MIFKVNVTKVGSISVFFLFSFHFVHSQSEWVLRKEKDGIFVYDLKTDTSKFNSIKVETELAGKVEDLLAILLDVKNHDKWAYGTKSASVLKRVSENEIIFYKIIDSPSLVVSDRDMVIRMKVIRNSASKVINVESIALPNFIPPKKDFVRVPFSNEKWTITHANQKIKINYFLQTDPGGSLSPFLVNLFITKGPYETFVNLRELLKSQVPVK
jgi:hypothetical protein